MGPLAVFREQDKRRAGYPYAGGSFFWKIEKISSGGPRTRPPWRRSEVHKCTGGEEGRASQPDPENGTDCPLAFPDRPIVQIH